MVVFSDIFGLFSHYMQLNLYKQQNQPGTQEISSHLMYAGQRG